MRRISPTRISPISTPCILAISGFAGLLQKNCSSNNVISKKCHTEINEDHGQDFFYLGVVCAPLFCSMQEQTNDLLGLPETPA